MKRKILIGVILLAVLATGIGLASCSAAGAAGAQATPTVLPAIQSDSTVVAEGKIVPVDSANLSFAGSGVVGEVLVAEGEEVTAGQVIARLSNADRMNAAVSAAQMELLSAEQALKDLNTNAELAAANAALKVAEARKALDKSEKRRTSKDYKWGDQEQIDIAWANYIANQDSVEKAEDAFSAFADRDVSDPDRAYMLSLLANARQLRDHSLAQYNFLVGKPNEMDISEADALLLVSQAELKTAEENYNKVKNGPAPDQLALAEARVDNAKAQLASAGSALADIELRAPFAGTVVSNPLKVGELINPAESFVVVADLAHWEVETIDLTELSIVNVQEGGPAKISVDALPELELSGTVTHIKALGEDRLGDITYKVTIALDKQDPALRWNMTASVRFE